MACSRSGSTAWFVRRAPASDIPHVTERRYSDEEAAEIFGRAARAEDPAPRALARTEGMTLAELQAAGREAGILPEKIAEAARALAADGTRFSRKLMGITIGVGRTVELDRKMSEEEWERVVVLLRETFDARGNVRSHGSLREWTNGNLQALLEPTATGHRLRLRTTHGAARAMMLMGVALLGTSVTIAAATVLTVGFRDVAVENSFAVGLIGAGSFIAGFLRRIGWARTRSEQMDAIAERLSP
jgi:hypothetical protein